MTDRDIVIWWMPASRAQGWPPIGTACVPACTRLPSVPRRGLKPGEAVGVRESRDTHRGEPTSGSKSGVRDQNRGSTQGAPKPGVNRAEGPGWYDPTFAPSSGPWRRCEGLPAGPARARIRGSRCRSGVRDQNRGSEGSETSRGENPGRRNRGFSRPDRLRVRRKSRPGRDKESHTRLELIN